MTTDVSFIQLRPRTEVILLHIYFVFNYSAGPLTAKLINNTPRIDGRTVTINFVLEGGSTVQLASLQCKIIGPGRTPPLITEHCMLNGIHYYFVTCSMWLDVVTV